MSIPSSSATNSKHLYNDQLKYTKRKFSKKEPSYKKFIEEYWKSSEEDPFLADDFQYESSSTSSQTLFENSLDLIEFYRQFPVVACTELLGIHLVFTQRCMLNVMWFYPNVCEVLSRGMSKTFMAAIVIMLRLLLYADIIIAVISKTFRQAQEVFTYVKKIMQWASRDDDIFVPLNFFKSQVLRMRADSYLTEIEMKHGSKAFAVPVGRDGSGGRGKRSHILFVDEAAQVPQKIVEMVANAYLNVLPVNPLVWGPARIPMNQRIYCSSASPQWHWFWTLTTDYAQRACSDPDRYRMLMLDYRHFESDPRSQFRVDWESYKNAKARMGKLEFKMEYQNWFISGSHNFFDINKLFEIKAGTTEYKVETRGSQNGLYMIVTDPAEVAEGDLFAAGVFKLFIETKTMVPVYLKAWNDGISMEDAAIALRILQHLFGAAYMVTDSKGGGAELVKQLTKEDDIENPHTHIPFRRLCMHDTRRGDALPVVWAVKFSSALNELMGWDLKHMVEQDRLKLPTTDMHANDPQIREISMLLNAMINEISNVRLKKSGINIGFTVSTGKKDLFSIAMIAAHYAGMIFADGLSGRRVRPKFATGAGLYQTSPLTNNRFGSSKPKPVINRPGSVGAFKSSR